MNKTEQGYISKQVDKCPIPRDRESGGRGWGGGGGGVGAGARRREGRKGVSRGGGESDFLFA